MKFWGWLLERHVQPRWTLQRAANLRGQCGCSYRAAWQAAINHALDRVRVMLGARFRGSVANQGIWQLTATRPKPTVSLRPGLGGNMEATSRLAVRDYEPHNFIGRARTPGDNPIEDFSG